MSEPNLSPVVDRAIEELRALPAVDPGTAERVAAVAIAARRRGDDTGPPPARLRRWLSYAAIAAAACVFGYLARGTARSAAPAPATAPTAPSSTSAPGVQLAADADAVMRPLAWQFVFRGEGAHHVALVGDFNGWNARATPLTRAPGGDLWSVTVPLMPGRHAYAFMVDDTAFVLDPQAPVSRDPDLGSRESVVVVERR